MARPRVAVDASVFATPVRIDRLVEADVRGVVRADDACGAIRLHARRHAIRRLLLEPPIVNRFDTGTVEAARWIRQRAASLECVLSDDGACHARTVRPYSWRVKTGREPCAAIRAGAETRSSGAAPGKSFRYAATTASVAIPPSTTEGTRPNARAARPGLELTELVRRADEHGAHRAHAPANRIGRLELHEQVTHEHAHHVARAEQEQRDERQPEHMRHAEDDGRQRRTAPRR